MKTETKVEPTTKAKQKSTVRHTRAIQRDRSKRPISPPIDEQMAARITELVHPETLAQVCYYHALGLRERILTLPVMMALVLSMLWRQLGSASELVRVVQTEALLWTAPVTHLTEKALNSRLRSLPAELFWRVLFALLEDCPIPEFWTQHQDPSVQLYGDATRPAAHRLDDLVVRLYWHSEW